MDFILEFSLVLPVIMVKGIELNSSIQSVLKEINCRVFQLIFSKIEISVFLQDVCILHNFYATF